MPMILNASPEVITAKHGGAIYHFKSGEKKDVFDPYAARDILNRWGKYGLVDVSFNEKVAKNYSDPELYTHEQKKVGIINYIESLEETVRQYAVYEDECGDRKTPERYQFQKQRKSFEDKILSAKKLLEDLEKVNVREIIAASAETIEEQIKVLQAKVDKLRGNNAGKSSDRSANRAS